jgi:hypothetical protein
LLRMTVVCSMISSSSTASSEQPPPRKRNPRAVNPSRRKGSGGRQDLANALRRRGFKVVAQLLANPNFLRNSGANPSTQAKPWESQGNYTSKSAPKSSPRRWDQWKQTALITCTNLVISALLPRHP